MNALFVARMMWRSLDKEEVKMQKETKILLARIEAIIAFVVCMVIGTFAWLEYHHPFWSVPSYSCGAGCLIIAIINKI